jgi:hypothetical protein
MEGFLLELQLTAFVSKILFGIHMTSRDFAYWLQGFFEIAKPDTIDPEQTRMVQRHLAMVFRHEIDPSLGEDLAELQAIHNGIQKNRPDPEYCKSTDHGESLNYGDSSDLPITC